MFPTFISILDIQSWWEVPSIAHFCSLFRTAFNLLDFDIEDLEEALLTDGTEESSWLQELIVRLLSGCLPSNEISTFNYQMFLRRLFRQKCQEHDRYNPFNTDIDFQLLPLRTKVDILHALCDFRLDAEDVLDQLKNLEADSLRVEPLGYDSNESAYWYFYGTRLYREDFKTKNNKKKSVWQVICFTEDDWFQLTKKLKKSTCKAERQLHHTLSENFLPELPRLFKEKENQARKRLLESLPRRSSVRIQKLVKSERETEHKLHQDEKLKQEKEKAKLEKEEKQRKKDLEKRRQQAYERRTKLKEQSEDSLSEVSEGRLRLRDQSEDTSVSERSDSRYEMAGNKRRKTKNRQRKISSGSASSKDMAAAKTSKRNKKSKKSEDNVTKSSVSKPTTVGRQTNNSLSAATGQILIQPMANQNMNKKKLKTSQVFRQTDEDLQIGMHKILDYVKNHEDAWPFADPVEEEYAPNYYSIVKKPMDLETMEERLESGYYKNFSKFRADFQLIVDNCRLYNGAENEYTEMVDNLLQVFEKATEKYLDQISSDDEIAVEVVEGEPDCKTLKKKKDQPSVSKRKPMLVAQTDNKRGRSHSEESLSSRRSASYESLEPDKPKHKTAKLKKLEKEEKVSKKQPKAEKREANQKRNLKEPEDKRDKTDTTKSRDESRRLSKNSKIKKIKKDKNKTPARNRSSSRSPSRSPARSDMSSPPPSWPASSPDNRFDFSPKQSTKKRYSQEPSDVEDDLIKGKQKKHSKLGNSFEDDGLDAFYGKKVSNNFSPPLSPKPKDKHNKLRETIEKLKAKSELARIKSTEYDFEFDDHPKENKDKAKKQDKDEKHKVRTKDKSHKVPKKDTDVELDGNSTMDSILSENKKPKKNPVKTGNSFNKNPATMDALSIATEQTLKDINKWLDDTPKFSEFSSASNSPSYTGLDEFDVIAGKMDHASGKKIEKAPGVRKEGTRDIKKRPFRDSSKFFKRREVQRTIDRLQPGKSKGNLISNVQSTKVDEMFPLGPLSKIKDTKNSLIVKTDTNAPKLSLGTVLDSFGKHKFVDDHKKEEDKVAVQAPKEETALSSNSKTEDAKAKNDTVKEKTEIKDAGDPTSVEDSSGGATPNLSAWFKAFGAPKIQPVQKKTESKADGKESDKSEDAVKDSKKVPTSTASPNPDSPLTMHGQPVPRQRKISTGSSVSERSSFSQDMDSPRVGMDERGAYPAPYPSPLHRSPSGASPLMVSPRPDISPKAAAYPTINGQIRVGFYQDTVSNKSSPDKSCSPREIPQSPYPQYSEHVYTPNTTESSYYSYTNSPYYTHPPNYSSTNPTPPYNMEMSSSSYYDTSKSLTDQYQAKAAQNYTANSPASNQSSPAPHPQPSPSVQHSPSVHPQHSPSVQSPGVLSPHSPSIHSQHSPQYTFAAFSKRAFAQHTFTRGMYQQHSPNVCVPQNSPHMNPQVHPQQSPAVQCQNSQLSPSLHASQQSPNVHPNSPCVDVFQHPEPEQNQASDKFLQQQQPTQSAMFPVKKRAYNDTDTTQQRFDMDARLPQRNLQARQQVSLEAAGQEMKDNTKPYVHQNIPDPKNLSVDSFGQEQHQQHPLQIQKDPGGVRNMNYGSLPVSNPYGSTFNDPDYLNMTSARMLATGQQNKIDMSKYTNMGYSGPDMNYSRSLQQYNRPELNYTRTTVPSSMPQKQQCQAVVGNDQNQMQPSGRCNNSGSGQQIGYKDLDPQQVRGGNFNASSEGAANTPGGFKPEVSIPRPTYNTSTLDMDQPLGLGRNITNLSHIVDRFSNDECLIAGLQTSASYYSEKGLGASHIFSKAVSTSASGLPMFSQANMAAMQSYNQNVQGTGSSMYNRQMTELQNPALMQNDPKGTIQPPPVQEKKSKKRKSSKNVATTNPGETQPANAANQGFQSYAGLKGNSSVEPSAISLKTSSVVPGSAFNFGPTPTGLGLSSTLYGDKDAYPNFLEDFRSAPNYYMAAAAAAHHRSTPETNEKQSRAAHQSSNPQGTPGYPFLGAPQARPGYPIGGPFIPNAQAQLMETSSPLYQHYLQAGVLNQGLLGPPTAYPPGYHPALSMRQPYDSMTRPPWL
ncbi:hypothetical protein NQ315_000936 [Exocentrus adspersus]|uniref:Bromo domain-containing protein n=1 Tax=Exocentrus adspersus TaxID=1586481 RepID=A0AAV8WEL4_9CUCU|nr:hypothetical protein NQ315_000936 [Exocentrus adspersus]